ncbi:MAG TPA: Kae1-associated serine/threonine protein kinase [Candidatus Altiarchaeales archaeon]|nr:Kae1-associated serine/threonine protein kinase [Candidatus Altiarchaeales archaeon]
MSLLPVAKGAEANLYRENGKLIKERIKKDYRIPELDLRLRRSRTKRESKLLERARRSGIYTPRIYETDLRNFTIKMEFIDGKLLRDLISEIDDSELDKLSVMIGNEIARMHNSNIIHNDLTTSNMILCNDRIYFIDFGLGLTSNRIEEKATDLVVLKKSLKAAHTRRFNLIWNSILRGYKNADRNSETIKRINTIEKRARYT